MPLNNLSVSQRLSAILITIFMSGVVFLVFQMVGYRQDLYAEKQQQLENLLDTITSQVQTVQAMPQDVQQTERLIKSLVRDARYQTDQYFFIFDQKLVMQVHPFKPSLEGKSVSNVNDATGTPLFQRMRAAASYNNTGFVEYMWPKPGTSDSIAKLSAVKQLPFNNWVIGTGTYIDDIEHQVEQRSWLFISFGLIWAALMIILGRFFIASIAKPLKQVGQCLHDMAEGDLTQPCPSFTSRDLSHLSNNINRMRVQIAELMGLVKNDSQQIVAATDQLQIAAQNGEQNTQKQHNELEQLSVAVNELSQTIQVMSGNANCVADTMNQATTAASEGEDIMDTARQKIHQLTHQLDRSVQSVGTLNDAANQIGNVAEVIASISEQTNLLALNAAIEAARAGESGRGFAVVADEVRTLAQRTGVATDEIKQVIDNIVNGTRDAVSVMQLSSQETQQCASYIDRAQHQLAAINVNVTEVKDMNIQLATSIEQQGQVTEEVNHNIHSLAQAADSNKQSAQELLQSSDVLNHLADKLDAQLSSFRTM